MIEPQPFSREQSRHLAEVRELWSALAPLFREKRALTGGLQWKTIGGHEYLYRYQPDTVTKKKRSTSVGRRSPETERLHDEFMMRRERVSVAIEAHLPTAETQARVSKALRLATFDNAAAAVIGALQEHQLLEHLVVTSTHAVAAYETSFGFTIPARSEGRLHFMLLGDELLAELSGDLERALHQFDKKIALTINDGLADITGERCIPVRFSTPSRFLSAVGRVANATDDQIDVLDDLLGLEPLPSFVIARSGQPVAIQVLDPRAYAFMTMLKRGADAEIGDAIARLAAESGDYEFGGRELAALPDLADAIGEYGDHGPRI